MTIIIGDTTSGLTVEEAKAYSIEYLPQIVIFGDVSYRDDIEIDTDTYVRKLKSAKSLPKTAAPPPALYHPIFEKMRENNDNAIIICPSQFVSGTYRSALTARNDFPDLDIRVIDTKFIGPPMAMELIEAKKMADMGVSIDEIENHINMLNQHTRLFALVDTLEFLYKGGRIGGASKIFGDVLQIKPILTVKDGVVDVFEKQRTSKKAITRVIDVVESEYSKDYQHFHLAMAGNVNLHKEDIEYFQREFSERLGITDFPLFKVPPAFMVHAGPGLIMVTYFTV